MQICHGDLAAVTLFRQVIDEATAAHDVMNRVYGLNMQANALVFIGDSSGARATAEEGLRDSAELVESVQGVCHAGVATAHLASGDAGGIEGVPNGAPARPLPRGIGGHSHLVAPGALGVR